MSESRPNLMHSILSGFLAGVLGGQVFLLVGLFRHGADLLVSAPTSSFAIWVVLRSVAVYGLLAGAVGLLIGLMVFLVTRIVRRGAWLVGPITLGVILTGTTVAYLSSWWQLEVLAGLPFEDTERMAGLRRHLLIGGAVGLGWVLVTAAAGHFLRWGRNGAPWRATGAVTLVCLVCLGLSQVALRTHAPAVDSGQYRPSQVVVIGLDAMTFRVMSPLLREGRLPTFQRLIDEGAWGSYLTYGQASSPMVWTSLATGKRVRDHGINDFVTTRPGKYGAEPMKSFDWRARAVWDILSDFGRRVGVIDWLITYPPSEVDGYLVTRLHMPEPNRTYPPELGPEVEQILARVEDYGDEQRTRNFSRLDHVFDTTNLLLEKEHLDFVAMFEGVSDWVEHRYWKFYEPWLFDPGLWDYTPQEVEQFGTMIPETYVEIDRRLGETLERLHEDALLIIVSDHGQLATKGRPVWMRLDRVLAALGFTDIDEAPDTDKPIVDHTTSRAYAAVETPWAPLIGVNLNVAGREPDGIVDPADVEELTNEVVRALRDVRFENGTPVFGAVYATKGEVDAAASASQADIVVTHSRFTRSDRHSQDTILVGDQTFRLDDFMGADTKISGGHDHQGIILVHGKCVRPGPVGQLVVSTAVQEILWHVTDKIDAVDPLLPWLARLGLIEKATTLDLTPTVLHALGLPVADDMAGRPLVDIVRTGSRVERIATYETDESGVIRAVDTESDEDMLKRLKALGYIN